VVMQCASLYSTWFALKLSLCLCGRYYHLTEWIHVIHQPPAGLSMFSVILISMHPVRRCLTASSDCDGLLPHGCPRPEAFNARRLAHEAWKSLAGRAGEIAISTGLSCR
jgi:hypothetical protein